MYSPLEPGAVLHFDTGCAVTNDYIQRHITCYIQKVYTPLYILSILVQVNARVGDYLGIHI